VARSAPNQPEYKRYRLALWVALGAAIGFPAVLVCISIVSELFFTHSPRTRPERLDLIACNRDVRKLVTNLKSETSGLLLASTPDRETRWDQFADEWQREWVSVNERCGFDDLADTGLGAAYDRMAWVHRNLATAKLKYRELVAHFSRNLAEDVAEMERALDKSREDLDRRPER
jgi:hypothetical protein